MTTQQKGKVMSADVWTMFDKNDQATWPESEQSSRGMQWPPSESFFLVYGRKAGEKKNGYHKALFLNGRFCWPMENVVAWSYGPALPSGGNARGFPVQWQQRAATSSPTASEDVLVLCSFLTPSLHWSVSRFNAKRNEWSIEKRYASVKFWCAVPAVPQ